MRWWKQGAAGVVLAGLLVAGVLLGHKTVGGVAVANPRAVSEASQERKVEAEKVAAEQQRQQAARELQQLETEVLDGMRDYFSRPENAMGDEFVVSHVVLFKTGDTSFEGVARMSVNGRPEKDIDVHVTADDRNLLWKTDRGALLPLFR